MRNGALPAALLLASVLVTIVPAQTPDCTGISDVSNFDGATVSSMDGVLTTVRVADGLLRPLFVAAPQADVERLFIVEQDGTVRILKNGSLLQTPFLDISALVQSPSDGWANEEGLLGLAFDPDYATNGHFYVYYTGTGGTNYSNWVDRFSVSGADPDLADPASRVNVIEFPRVGRLELGEPGCELVAPGPTLQGLSILITAGNLLLRAPGSDDELGRRRPRNSGERAGLLLPGHGPERSGRGNQSRLPHRRHDTGRGYSVLV